MHGRRLGRRRDLGAQRRAGHERPQVRQRRGRAARGHRRLRLGRRQNDFGADGHIGFLDSTVKDGKFTALEGNNADAGQRRPAQTSAAARRSSSSASRATRRPAPRRRSRRRAGRLRRAAVERPPRRRRSRSTRRSSAARAPGRAARPSAEALALLKNKNIVLDSVGVADIKAGRIDPRVIGVLTKLSAEHKITVSCMCSDHSKFTAGGSVSNHHFGRGADIATIDGEIVGPGSPLAREVASELSSLDPDIRPNEIGSPFAINGPGYFTDAAHQNHLHLGFKQEIPSRLEAAGRRRRRPGRRAASGRAGRDRRRGPARRRRAPPRCRGLADVPQGGHRDRRRGRPQEGRGQRLAGVPEGGRAAEGARRRGRPGAPPRRRPPPRRSADRRRRPPAPRRGRRRRAAAPDAYPGDDAPREQIAAWMAGQATSAGCRRSCR